jgi:hypothetical protein
MLAPFISLMACEQATPPGADTSGDAMDATDGGDAGAEASGGDTGSGQEVDSYFPLVDGGHWEYVSRTTTGQVLGTEIVDASATTFEGQDALLFVDNPDQNGEWTESWISRQDTAARRIHKEIKDGNGTSMIVNYAPGFTRFDDAWTAIGAMGELTYERTETDGLGLNPVVDTRGHSFDVTGIDQSVTVPAGTFNCIAITRTRTTGMTAGEQVHFWYAPGVGKVKEERPADNRVEELTKVSIPGGAVYP